MVHLELEQVANVGLVWLPRAAVAKAAAETGVASLPYPAHYPLADVDGVFPS